MTRREQISFLLYAARSRIDQDVSGKLQQLAESGFEWDYLLDLAKKQRVSALLYQSLSSIDGEIATTRVMNDLKSCLVRRFITQSFMLNGLFRIIELFKSRGIRTISFKGPLLAFSVYGDIAKRQFYDLDLLVSEEQFGKASRILQQEGFKKVLWNDAESHYQDPSSKLIIDLHRKVTESNWFPIAFDFDLLWSRGKTIQIANNEIRTFSPEDSLIVLCVEMIKDACEGQNRLAKLCDIAESLRSNEHINGIYLTSESRRLGIHRIVSVAVSLAMDMLDAPIPSTIRAGIEDSRRTRALCDQIKKQLFQEDHPNWGQWNQASDFKAARIRYHWMVRERLQHRMIPYLRPLLPNDRDRDLIALPPYLGFLYFGIRPVRIIVEHLFRVSRSK